MINRSKDFDLGRDRSRIKDPRDAARQESTVDVLLSRFFGPRSSDRFEIQILADEVGCVFRSKWATIPVGCGPPIPPASGPLIPVGCGSSFPA